MQAVHISQRGNAEYFQGEKKKKLYIFADSKLRQSVV